MWSAIRLPTTAKLPPPPPKPSVPGLTIGFPRRLRGLETVRDAASPSLSADLTGYTRLTEEEGELTALDAVERFVEAVENTLPEEARVIKTIGDEAMIVGPDPSALTDWAVGFQRLYRGRPPPRIAIHYGVALFREGDYYGRDVNIASRVAARAAGGEVLVSAGRWVGEKPAGRYLRRRRLEA